eukprot:660623-Pleurochrysis_carterae.AAC.2
MQPCMRSCEHGTCVRACLYERTHARCIGSQVDLRACVPFIVVSNQTWKWRGVASVYECQPFFFVEQAQAARVMLQSVGVPVELCAYG